MATSRYKFVNVPKTFTTKAAALQFLSNSPGYVSRQSTYLNKYWPGLMADLEQSKRKRQELDKRRNSKPVTKAPPKDARAYSAKTSIFVPPAFTTKPKGGSAPPPRRTLVTPPAAPVDDGTVEREKFQLGLSKKKQTPNVADLVPTPKPGGGQWSLLDPLKNQVDRVKPVADIASSLGDKALGYGAGDLLRDANDAGNAVAKAFTPTDYRGDLSRGDFLGLGSMPAAKWVASADAPDTLLGKSIPNLFEGVARDPFGYRVGGREGLNVATGIVTSLPVVRGPKAGLTLLRRAARAVPENVERGAAEQALAAGAERIAAIDAQLETMAMGTKKVSPATVTKLTKERDTLLAGKAQLEGHLGVRGPVASNVTPPGKVKPNDWKVTDPRRVEALDKLLWKQRPPAVPTPHDAERVALINDLRQTRGKALPTRMKGAQAMAVIRLIDKLADKGVRGRFWYSKSAEGILNLVHGDMDMARKLTALIAIYSPQQAVVQNIALAKKAMDEYLVSKAATGVGVITTGGKDAVKIGKAMAVMEHGDTAFSGRKTSNFYRNIFKYLDPEAFAADPEFHGLEVTADMWMARLFGYKTDVVSDGRYDVIERVVQQIAREKGWTPDEVQAATWVAMKDLDPWDVSPNVDFAGAIDRNTMTVNLETTKGITGIGADLTPEQTAAVNAALMPTIANLAEKLGIVIRLRATGEGIRQGTSAYEAERNASLHFDMFERPETVQRFTNILAKAFDQLEVWAVKPGSVVGGVIRPGLHITAPELDNPEIASKFFASLNAAHPKKMQGFTPYRDGGGITIVSTGSKTNPELQAWGAEFEKAINDAADAAGISHVEYEGQNLGIIKGVGQSGDSEVSGGAAGLTGGRERTLDDQLAAEGRAALEREVARAGTAPEAPGLASRLGEETGTLTIGRGPRPETGDLDAILAQQQGGARVLGYNAATVEMQQARSRVSRLVLERPADSVSRWLDKQTPSSRAISRALWSAPASMRVAKQMGRGVRVWGSRLAGGMERHQRALPKPGSFSDTAHFWYAQLHENLRNARGLEAIRRLQATELQKIGDGTAYNELVDTMNGLKAKLGVLRQEHLGAAGDIEEGQWVHTADRGNWGRVLDVDDEGALVHFVSKDGAQAKVRFPLESLRGVNPEIKGAEREVFDIIKHLEDTRIEMTGLKHAEEDLKASIVELGKLIENPPKYDPRVVSAMKAFSEDRKKIMQEAGYLQDEDGVYAREGILSRALGMDQSGEEVYVGHRMQKPRASSDPYPTRLGVGRPGLPPGITKQNQLKNVLRGRVRSSTHVVVDDWLASQTFRQAQRTRHELGTLGVRFNTEKFDPKTMYLVNPKGRAIPASWKNGNKLDQLADRGYDENEIRQAAKELTDNYMTSDNMSDEAIQTWRELAEENGVQWHELRMVDKKVAKRYFNQFAKPAKAMPVAGAYDTAVDVMVASLIFARIGYIPKNIVQNLIMAMPHQGVYLFANVPRAMTIMLDPKLDELQRRLVAEVGGGTLALGDEVIGASAKTRKGAHAIAQFSGNVADSMPRVAAFLHEAAAMGVIPKTNPKLRPQDVDALLKLISDPTYTPLVDTIRSRSVESMADFSRLTPTQSKHARRWLIIPGWLWAGSRYPVKFAASYPGRTAAIGYVAAGEPGGDRVGLPQNRPITDYMAKGVPEYAKGIETPWGVLRTGSLSPVSTPKELFEAATGFGNSTVGGYANPLPSAIWNVLHGQIESPRGGAYQKGTGLHKYLNALEANTKRLVPNWKLIEDLIKADEGKVYPDDKSRLRRLLRETGVAPVRVTREGDDKKVSRSSSQRSDPPKRGSSAGRRKSDPPKRRSSSRD